MKVFISWSGLASQAIGGVLRDWLPNVLQTVEPYLSSEDIEKGSRWSIVVSGELEACQFGILCLTADNLAAPWVNFEAGALSKSLQTSRVTPFLVGLSPSDLTGPLAQFQATVNSVEDVKRMMRSMNTVSEHPIPDDRVDNAVDIWWPKLVEDLRTATEVHPVMAPEPTRSTQDMLGELLILVRGIESNQRQAEARAHAFDPPPDGGARGQLELGATRSGRFARPLAPPPEREENDVRAVALWLAGQGLEAQKIRQSANRIEVFASFPADIEVQLKNFCLRRGLAVEFYSPNEERLLRLDEEDNTGTTSPVADI